MKRPWSAVTLSILLTVAIDAGAAASRTPTTINAQEVVETPRNRVFIEAHGKTEAEILQLRRELIAAGASSVNLFLPAVIVCDVPVEMSVARLIKDPGYSYYDESELGPQRVASMSDNMRWAERAYDLAWLGSVENGTPQALPDDFHDKVMHPSRNAVEASRQFKAQQVAAGAAAPRLLFQNAEFMIGDILVRIVLPESNGGAEVSTENWTDTWMTNAISGGSSACLAFQEKFAFAPMNYVFEAHRAIDTRYEAITHTTDSDELWITDVMATLGYAGFKDFQMAVHTFNEDGRKRFGTDWSYTAFVANSRNAPNHLWGNGQPAGYTAYAILGGPYFVIPYPAGQNDPNELGEVLLYSKIYQHEMVHIFWGLDEYEQAPSQCSSWMGYLRYLNNNKQSRGPDGSLIGCPGWVPCIMWGAREDDGRPVCKWTAGQMGVIDENSNNVPDIFDMPPIVEFTNSEVETVTTPELTVGMRIVSQAVPNQNPVQSEADRINYAAPLRNAVITVAGVDAFLTPEDGKWDESEEYCSFTFTGLEAGRTTIRVRATNSFGLTSGRYIKKIYFIGINFGQFSIRARNEAIDINFNLVGETFGAKMDLYRIQDGKTTLLAEGLEGESDGSGAFTYYSYMDLDVEPGAAYAYYVKGSFDLDVEGVSQYYENTSNVFEMRAMVPMANEQMMSRAAPNPFNGRTAVSVRVPETLANVLVGSGIDGPGPQLSTPRPVPTQVSVNVYDVKGRFVKQVYDGGLFAQVFTVEWDGTNQAGDAVSSGVYFIKSIAGPAESTRKVVVVR